MWLAGPKLVLPDGVLPVGSLRLEGERIAEIRQGQVGKGSLCEDLPWCPA